VQSAARCEQRVWDSVNSLCRLGGNSLNGMTYTNTDITAGTIYFYIIRSVNAGVYQAHIRRICP